MQTIRKAYAILGKELETVHPFCHSKLSTDGTRIFLSVADSIGDANLVSDLFDVRPEDVLNAVSFEEQYGLRRAA